MLSQEIKTVSKWAIDFGEEVDSALSDGWQWKDLTKFIDDFFAAPGMANAAPAAVAQVKAGISEEDRVEWIQYVKSEFDIPHKNAEKIVEGTIKWLIQTDEFLRLFIKKKS